MTTHTARHRRTGLDRLRTLLLAALVLGLLLAAGVVANATHAHAAVHKPNPAWTCERVPSVLHMTNNTWCHRTRFAPRQGVGGLTFPTSDPSPAPTSVVGSFVPFSR